MKERTRKWHWKKDARLPDKQIPLPPKIRENVENYLNNHHKPTAWNDAPPAYKPNSDLKE